MRATRNIATEYVQVPNRGMDSRAQIAGFGLRM